MLLPVISCHASLHRALALTHFTPVLVFRITMKIVLGKAWALLLGLKLCTSGNNLTIAL
jgi:hypothetical protein